MAWIVSTEAPAVGAPPFLPAVVIHGDSVHVRIAP